MTLSFNASAVVPQTEFINKVKLLIFHTYVTFCIFGRNLSLLQKKPSASEAFQFNVSPQINVQNDSNYINRMKYDKAAAHGAMGYIHRNLGWCGEMFITMKVLNFRLSVPILGCLKELSISIVTPMT